MYEGTEAIINAELDAIESSRDRGKILAICLIAAFALAQIADVWAHPGGGRAMNVKTDERPRFVMDMVVCPPIPGPAEPVCHALWHWGRGEPINE